MESTMTQSITIRCNVKDLFDYIKNPCFWSEWPDQSTNVNSVQEEFRGSDRFKEKQSIQLFSGLPFKFYQQPVYEVLEVFPNQKYVIQGKIQKTDIRISYEFIPITNKRTKFKKTLTVKSQGAEKVFHPFLYFYFKHTSHKALSQLKKICEINF